MSAAASAPVSSFQFPLRNRSLNIPFPGASLFTFEEFQLDTVNQCLWKTTAAAKAERILPTPTIFALLRYMVENAGRLITHDELLDALWRGVYVSAEVLKRHVFSLRSLLGDGPKSPRFIETLPRRGYQFIAPVTPQEDEVAEWEDGGADENHSLRELTDCLRIALTGQRQLVFITGIPGTRNDLLIDQFLSKATLLGRGVLTGCGQCVSRVENRAPYFPVLQAMNQVCLGPTGRRAAQILAAHAPTWFSQIPSLLGSGQAQAPDVLDPNPARMLREMGDALDTIASTSPVILVLEDLQWADPCTVDLISAIARSRTRAKLMVVGTYFPSEAPTQHPLRALKPELLARRLCREVEFAPMVANAA